MEQWIQDLFLTIFNMSIASCYVIAAVLLVRLFLRRAPKKYSYLLWSVVGFRLICPVTPEAFFSLFSLRLFQMRAVQSADPHRLQFIPKEIGIMKEPKLATGLEVLNTMINPQLPEAAPQASVNPMQMIVAAAALICFAGISLMLLYSLIAWGKLRRLLRQSIRIEKDVYRSDRIDVPFILGFLRPRIYIPCGLEGQALSYVLAHERYHLKRRDYLIKLFAYCLLMLHWFNPLCWAAFICMCRDMEMSCDEKVLSMQQGEKTGYSMTLLSIAAKKKLSIPCVLAFGENNVKRRIVNVLNWKKPSIRITAAAAAVCLAVIGICATNPVRADHQVTESSEEETGLFGHSYRIREFCYDAPQYSFVYTKESAPVYQISEDGRFAVTVNPYYAAGSVIIDPEGWIDLEEFCLTQDNLDMGFMQNPDGDTLDLAEQLRKENLKAWRGTGELPDNELVYQYYLLEQKDRSIYLVEGYSRPDDTQHIQIRWVFELEQFDHCYVGFQAEEEEIAERMGRLFTAANWYPEGDPGAFANLPAVSAYGDGELLVRIDWDADAIEVTEERHVISGADSEVSEAVYQVECGSDGLYHVPVKKQSDGMEYVIYKVMDGEACNMFRLYFEDEEAVVRFSCAADESEDEDTFRYHAGLNLNYGNGVFTFVNDLLSSYLMMGHFTREDDRIICRDERYELHFRILDAQTLMYVEEGSHAPEPVDDRFGSRLRDGDLFQKITDHN